MRAAPVAWSTRTWTDPSRLGGPRGSPFRRALDDRVPDAGRAHPGRSRVRVVEPVLDEGLTAVPDDVREDGGLRAPRAVDIEPLLVRRVRAVGASGTCGSPPAACGCAARRRGRHVLAHERGVAAAVGDSQLVIARMQAPRTAPSARAPARAERPSVDRPRTRPPQPRRTPRQTSSRRATHSSVACPRLVPHRPLQKSGSGGFAPPRRRLDSGGTLPSRTSPPGQRAGTHSSLSRSRSSGRGAASPSRCSTRSTPDIVWEDDPRRAAGHGRVPRP